MAYFGSVLDAALLALEVEIFADDSALTDSDRFLTRALSCWSPAEKRQVLSALIHGYGKPDIDSHIVHALARLICQDVELQLTTIYERVGHRPG